MTKVLVVDDEASISEFLTVGLRYEGFEVATAETGRRALEQVQDFRPNLVILDVLLPDLDGFDIARRLRGDGLDVPILFLTARDATEDKVRGLTVGGDDYVTKPFSLDELVARVRTILRRAGSDGETNRLQFADLEMDLDTYDVSRGDLQIELTPTEFKLLRYLMLNPRRVLSKAQIVDHVWNYDFDGEHNVVETYVSYLRKKVDRVDPPLIHTVRGFGYTLRTPKG